MLCPVERMRSLRLPAPVLVLLAFLAVAAFFAPAPAAAAGPADGITRGTIYQDGPDNRYLLGGEWLFRRDDAGHRPARGLPAPARAATAGRR